MATSVTYQDLQQLSSEFESCPGPFLTRFIEQACRRVDECFWGSLYDDGILYLSAHLATVARAGSQGAAGPATRKKARDLELEFKSDSGFKSKYSSTVWGREFEILQKTLCFKATVRAI